MAAGFTLFALDLVLQWLFGAKARRETLVVSLIDGASQHVAILPGNSALPIVTAAVIS